MSIEKDDVAHVARLARLELTEAEQDAFCTQLGAILEYVDQLKTLDTDGLEQTATIPVQTNVLREDVPRPGLAIQHTMANAPEQIEGYFAVPKILEDRER